MQTNNLFAAQFMASFSSAGRDIAAPKMCSNCKTNRARWDSIYCSDDCRSKFLTFSEKEAA